DENALNTPSAVIASLESNAVSSNLKPSIDRFMSLPTGPGFLSTPESFTNSSKSSFAQSLDRLSLQCLAIPSASRRSRQPRHPPVLGARECLPHLLHVPSSSVVRATQLLHAARPSTAPTGRDWRRQTSHFGVCL